MKCPICGKTELQPGEKACHKCRHDAEHVREIMAEEPKATISEFFNGCPVHMEKKQSEEDK